MAKKATQVSKKQAELADIGTDLVLQTEKKRIEHSYAELLESHKTKSAMIRFLSVDGYDRGQIAKFMGIKYQFVRNVLITPIKKTS